MKTRPVMSFVFGLLGTLVCMVSAIAVLVLGIKVSETTEQAFDVLSDALAASRSMIEGTSARIGEARLEAEDLERGLKEWSRGKATAALGNQLGLPEKSQKISAKLEIVDQWLDVAESSVTLVDKSIKVLAPLGVEADSGAASQIATEVATLRGQLQACSAMITKLAEGVESGPSEPTEPDRPLVGLASKLVLTLTPIDEHFEAMGNRVAALEEECRTAGKSTRRTIHLVTCGLILFALWMGAGQVALCLGGWRRLQS